MAQQHIDTYIVHIRVTIACAILRLKPHGVSSVKFVESLSANYWSSLISRKQWKLPVSDSSIQLVRNGLCKVKGQKTTTTNALFRRRCITYTVPSFPVLDTSLNSTTPLVKLHASLSWLISSNQLLIESGNMTGCFKASRRAFEFVFDALGELADCAEGAAKQTLQNRVSIAVRQLLPLLFRCSSQEDICEISTVLERLCNWPAMTQMLLMDIVDQMKRLTRSVRYGLSNICIQANTTAISQLYVLMLVLARIFTIVGPMEKHFSLSKLLENIELHLMNNEPLLCHYLWWLQSHTCN